MIKEDILEFRFGVPIGRLDYGYLHTKLAIYYDKNNKGVVVFGSQNDSHQATINDETLTVFTNWAFGQDYFNDYVKLIDEKMSKAMEDYTEKLQAFDLEIYRLQPREGHAYYMQWKFNEQCNERIFNGKAKQDFLDAPAARTLWYDYQGR